ncbi:MAG: alpha/beta hydrolase fold domain-containing protein, partial [Planctomycetaceae bacterium]|nr:alpha/beta hydrolase fold domain-containing protein [Planctomycetaceae bacterium]
MRPHFGLLPLLVIGVLASNTTASDGSPKVIRNLSYGPAPQQVLDLYLTDQPGSPLIVWVHGGAWRAGSKDNVPILELVKRGYNIASVEYRLSPIAKFPAQVHDIKAAI